MDMCTSPLVEMVPPSPIINSSRRAGARRVLRRQEKRKSQENAEGGNIRAGVEKLGGIKAVGAHNRETSREKLATNCDGNRVKNENCDRTENNYDQDCSQSLLKKQSDDDIKEEEGDGEAGEAKQVIEDQISLEEWGEDDLQVG